MHEVIQAHRRYLVELMQQWTRIKEDEAGSDLNLALVVDAELFRLDAVVRWLDAADGRLKRAAADPPPPRAGTAPQVRCRDGEWGCGDDRSTRGIRRRRRGWPYWSYGA